MGFLKIKYFYLMSFSALLHLFIDYLVKHDLKYALIAIFIVVFLDTFTGVFIAIKSKQFNSDKFSKIFYKLVVYPAVILIFILLYSATKINLIHDFISLSITLIIVNELISIVENLFVINPKTKILLVKIFELIKNLKNFKK